MLVIQHARRAMQHQRHAHRGVDGIQQVKIQRNFLLLQARAPSQPRPPAHLHRCAPANSATWSGSVSSPSSIARHTRPRHLAQSRPQRWPHGMRALTQPARAGNVLLKRQVGAIKHDRGKAHAERLKQVHARRHGPDAAPPARRPFPPPPGPSRPPGAARPAGCPRPCISPRCG